MILEIPYIVGVHRYAFKAGEAGKVVGVKMCTPDRLETRPAFEVHYESGEIDFVSFKDVELGNYQFITKKQKEAGQIPPISK